MTSAQGFQSKVLSLEGRLHTHLLVSFFAGRSLIILMLFMPQAMYGWGKVLQTYYGKNPSLMYEDPTVKYLGFWTDNGKCIVCHEVLGR